MKMTAHVPMLLCALVPMVFAMSHGKADEYEAFLEQNRADLMAFFNAHIDDIEAESALGDITTENWPARRDRERQKLASMLGLDPMPPREALHATVTGVLDHEEFVVEKLHFQALPGLYVTGNLYVPKRLEAPAPAILYLCGHARRVEDGVSLGNKTAYQRHPAWFARHGYVCFIVDTIQLGEIEGVHHGTRHENMWWWNSRGYTPAGVEAFNAIRALDYLESRPEIDPDRIGVTGRSGGGIGTLYLAALDDRVAVAAPVAGITDIRNHVGDFLTPRHCDCNYFPNRYRFDYPRIVSLIAPRPLLIANSDQDGLFPLDGVQRVHQHVRAVYHALEATEKLGLAITVGSHGDTQQLRVPVFSWFNRHLMEDDFLIQQPAEPLFDEIELRVFDELPNDEIVTTIHDTFVPAAEVALPETLADWEAQRTVFLDGLAQSAFRNWPESYPEFDASQAFSVEREDVLFEGWDITIEPQVRLRVYIMRATSVTDPERIVALTIDESSWADGLASLSATFEDLLPPHPDVESDVEAFQQSKQWLEGTNAIWVAVAPRGIGPTAWVEPDSSDAINLRRCFPILGLTLDGQRVLDITRSLAWLREHDGTANLPIMLHAQGDMAALALYAAILDRQVDDLQLHHPPSTHHDGAELSNVLQFMDLPQALAMALEHGEVNLMTDDATPWTYAEHVADLLDRGDTFTLRIVPGSAPQT